MATLADTTTIADKLSCRSAGQPHSGNVLGLVLIIAGIILLSLAAVLSDLIWVADGLANSPQASNRVAIGLLFLVWGFIFRNPATLRDGTDPSPSAMRVAMLVIISVFALCAVREGWQSGSLEISTGWIGIITAAIAGKVAQSFAEARTRRYSRPAHSGLRQESATESASVPLV